MNSLEVCLSQIETGPLLVCPPRDEPGFGPIVSYAFTDTHLLLRTLGAKSSSNDPKRYEPDIEHEFFFLVDKDIADPYLYDPVGPLNRASFQEHSAVPADVEWSTATNPSSFSALVGATLFVIVSLAFFGAPWLLVALFIAALVLAYRKFILRRQVE